MAKPIPVNRRFLENHQGAMPTPPEPAHAPTPQGNPRNTLREVIALLRRNSRNDEPDWEDELWDAEDELEFEDEELDHEYEVSAEWDDEEELGAPQWADEEADFYPEDEADILDPEELYEAYAELEEDAPVISARYSGTCPVCGNPIRVGDRITRHAHIDAWVHVGCRYNPSRAPFRSLAARYDGYCRLCRQPFPAGQAITNLPGYGWVHLECARQHQEQD